MSRSHAARFRDDVRRKRFFSRVSPRGVNFLRPGNVQKATGKRKYLAAAPRAFTNGAQCAKILLWGCTHMGERKFLRTFICLTLMLSILLGTFGAQAAERTVTILELTNDFVYIRSSTGENSQIIGTLRKGTRMFYRGRSGSMAYVCTVERHAGLCLRRLSGEGGRGAHRQHLLRAELVSGRLPLRPAPAPAAGRSPRATTCCW